jgi:cellulose synthase/poly-beta-1,6-N-acetylglucosamine synthase-like glycosyltransferase
MDVPLNEQLPVIFETQVLMILTVLCSIPKTFLFLRVFGGLSYIVTMLFNVISDLKVFLLFYGILIVFFAQFITILGIGNCAIDTSSPGHDGFMNEYSLPGKGGKGYSGRCNWNPDEDA